MKWLFRAIRLVLVVCLACSALLLFLTVFSRSGNLRVLKVLSGSMEPKIKVGSLILIKKVGVDSVKAGSIVTFHSKKNPDLLITHRVIKKEEKDGEIWFSTKGDANDTADISRIRFDQINGKVLLSLPLVGYVSAWISSLWGFLSLIVLPAVYIIISEILNIKNIVEKEVEKKYRNAGKNFLVFIILFLALGRIKSVSAYFSDVIVVSDNVFSTGYWVDNPCGYIWGDYEDCFENSDHDCFQVAACVRNVMRELKTCMFRNRIYRCPVWSPNLPYNEVDAVCRFDFSFADQLIEERLIRSLRFDLHLDKEFGNVILTVFGIRCGQKIEYLIDYSAVGRDRQIKGEILDSMIDHSFVKERLFLGTCSFDVCVADQLVENKAYLTVFLNQKQILSQQEFFF